MEGVPKPIMDKDIQIRLICETGRNCLDDVDAEGNPKLSVKICLNCDFAQIEVLEIKDHEEKEDTKEKPKEFAPKEEGTTKDSGVESTGLESS